MLLSSNISKYPSVDRLVKLWGERYTVDVSSLCKNPKFYGQLMKASLPEARALTASKLWNNVIHRTKNQAEIQVKTLYQYIPEIIDSQLGQRINQAAGQVYEKVLEMYQQQSGVIVTPMTRQITTENVYNQVSLLLSAIPDIEELANDLEPLLLKYQDQHITANDWRVVGFLTTLFNFSNKLLINQLTPVEKILLCSYFKFVEEEVALPWRRVCAAAAKHEVGSPALTLVEQMLPMAHEISSTVYCRLLQLFPDHHSLRGGLSKPDVAHSCLRDLDMFQAYLWLSVLEESIKPVEEELVPLCVMVMPTVGVKWEMIDKWKQLLIDEIESYVQPEEKHLLLNYTQGMEQAFFEARNQLSDSGKIVKFSYIRENLSFDVNS
ncbi:hypothetical protein H6G81_25285 [Scytonema hofmannii FACHB-248]|uniref:Uncharacterized protein n=1 Tax=Scytonema hofmannii FACHB-248 TaxID=1842502 RepID=A0ABR8GW68_9CYAN|nr:MULTISPECIES: hypothetical protein [Nostocales]MBD2607751.1 hypothetical protein [Scytonema hofmannii FACHB-248]